MKELDKTKGQEILRLYNSLVNERQAHALWWDKIREFVLPNRPDRLNTMYSAPDGVMLKNVYDATAADCSNRLAAAHQSHMTSPFEVWFGYEGREGDSDQARSWYKTCGEIAYREFGYSNFYPNSHEMYRDRCALGTGCIFADNLNNESRLNFVTIPCGEFVAAEDSFGEIRTVIREIVFTAEQIVEKWPEAILPEAIKKAYEEPTQRYTEKFTILHCTRKRLTRNVLAIDSRNMPYESIYCLKNSGEIIEEGGYEEWPYCVTRFDIWSDAYGVAPARVCWPHIIGAQVTQKNLQIVGSLAINPRIKTSAKYVGDIDLRAGGSTVIDPNDPPHAQPQEWASITSYQTGMVELERHQTLIRSAYFTDELEPFAAQTKQMSATEASYRQGEKMLVFSPTFSLFMTEFRVLMERVFNVLFRAGKFPKPPAEIMELDPHSGAAGIKSPVVMYSSKYSQMLKALESNGLMSSVNIVGQIMQMSPGAIDNIDIDYVVREVARSMSAPEKMLIPMDQVTEKRQQAQQEQLAMMAAQAELEKEAKMPAEEPLT